MRAWRRGVRASLAACLVIVVACQSALPGAPAADCPTAAPTADQATTILTDAAAATVDTSLGTFVIDLRADVAPIATANFVSLARCGFYEGVTFHRVLAGFVVQAGDPNTRDNPEEFEGLGSGGPGYSFGIETPPEGLNYDPYTVAMANTAMPNSNGSQFFICLTDLNAQFPDRSYTIFGLVTDGREVVDAIGAVAVHDPIDGVPIDPVVINRVGVEPPAPAESTAP